LPTRLVSPWTGLAHRPSWRHHCQARATVVLTGRAISVPFRARRHRFATVNHGHSRSFDLRAPYYRCAAARMVRMGSLVRCRRSARPAGGGAPTPPSSAGRRRTPRHTTPLARYRVTASGAQAARIGSPRLKNEWVRLIGSASRDPGHSLLTRERRPARDGGSGSLVWPSAGGRHPPFIAVNGPETPAPGRCQAKKGWSNRSLCRLGRLPTAR
jgi:hypothetical protein